VDHRRFAKRIAIREVDAEPAATRLYPANPRVKSVLGSSRYGHDKAPDVLALTNPLPTRQNFGAGVKFAAHGCGTALPTDARLPFFPPRKCLWLRDPAH
jgi:hypothetical protein